MNRRTLLAAGVALAMIPAAAMAHGPTRQTVSYTHLTLPTIYTV